MLTLTEQVSIEAKAETVFDVITDFARYGEWNPWLPTASGKPAEGEMIDVSVRLGQNKTTDVRHHVLTSKRGVEFRWCDTGWFTALAYGERARYLVPLAGGGVEYRVELRFTGVASALVRALYGRAMAAGLKAETLALKARAESLS
jgi:hypothetical protein